MFKGNNLWEIIQVGGVAMYALIFCSILSLAVILERLIYFWQESKIQRNIFIEYIRKELQKGNVPGALEMCQKVNAPFSSVVSAGINLHAHSREEISNAMEREITIQTARLERHTSVVGTIGSVAVYIGLLGTVLGIIRAFRDIATSGSGGINIVIGGVSEALVCTAAGLCVAVPAVIAYNYFSKRIEGFITDMELCASEVLDLLKK